jgi:NOL1/NOP2/sun family putative RNA methylase
LQAFHIYRDIIPEFDRFLLALERPHPSHLRVNTLKIDDESLKELLKKYNCHLEPLLVRHCYSFSGLQNPGATVEYFLGYYHMQGLSSVLPSLVLEPSPQHRVLDMCASPGSKTTHIAAIMDNRGLIVANELNRRRLSILKFHLERLGVTNTLVTTFQAQNFPMRYPDRSEIRFDRVLLDAPCSGEGRYRKVMRPDELKKMQPYGEEHSLKMSNYQRQMILRGFDLLKEGGIMVYSTCTYSPYENEAVVDYLLKTRKNAVLEPIRFEGINLVEGVTEWKGIRFSEELKKTVRVYPHLVDSWGFFIARIRKL